MRQIILIIFCFLFSISVFAQSDYEKKRKEYIESLKQYSFTNLDTFTIENKQVLVYHFPFQIGNSDIDNISRIELENMFLNFYILNKRKVKRIQVFGHTDLFQTAENENYDFNSTCASSGLSTNSNNCLGLVRAVKVHKILNDFLIVHNKNELRLLTEEPKYHNDFFLRCCDEIVSSKLLSHIGILEFTNELKSIIYEIAGSSPTHEFSITEIRHSNSVQEYIKSKRDEYVENFKPFRCVVIINTY